MAEHKPRTSIAGLMIATAVFGAAFAWWSAAPLEGELNTVIAAVAIAFAVALITPFGMFLAIVVGTVFIGISMTMLVGQDPSGLGPPVLTIPIQSVFASGPMAGAAWLGRELRRRLSHPPTNGGEPKL